MPTLLSLKFENGLESDLTLIRFTGREEISRLFNFTLTLWSKKHDIDPHDAIGKSVTFGIEPDHGDPRYFNGYVSHFTVDSSKQGECIYTAEVVPWVWFLTQTSDCRVFSGKTVKEILETVLNEVEPKPQSTFDLKISHSYEPYEYCIQYRETDFNFLSRIMEQEGIFYYFKHEDGGHTMVIGDAPSHYADDSAHCGEVPFNVQFHLATPERDPYQSGWVNSWVHSFQFVPGGYEQTDYNYDEYPPRSEQSPAKNPGILTTQEVGGGKPPAIKSDVHQLYDYPADYALRGDKDHMTQVRMEEEKAAYEQIRATGVQRFLSAGLKFTLNGHSHKDGEYLVRSISHAGSSGNVGEGGEYENSFVCIPSDVTFRPPRVTRKPVISGVQTAVVVGSPGNEIEIDKFGRAKVQFLWDRYGKRMQSQQEEPCWVRVTQMIAGNKWGALFLPRIGQEVVVTFLEGDPDRPLITGGVYNAEQVPPYDHDEYKTVSCLKTNTSPGGEGFNELRFDDKKDDEQIFIHAQRDMDTRVLNDVRSRIFGHKHRIVGWEKDGDKGGDLCERVYQDRHNNIKRNQIEHIEGNYELMVGNGGAADSGKVDVVIEKQVGVAVGAQGVNVNIEGDKKEKIDGSQSLTVVGDRKEKVANLHRTVQGNVNEKYGGKHSLEAMAQHAKLDADFAVEAQTIHIKAGSMLVLEAGAIASLKVGGNYVTVSTAGTMINGSMVLINSGGAAASGMGVQTSSPDSPDEPSASDVAQAAPKEPELADNAKSGVKSTPFD